MYKIENLNEIVLEKIEALRREDGLIEKALRVMGATPGTFANGYHLERVNVFISTVEADIPRAMQALFIHECKLYLQHWTECTHPNYGFQIEIYEGGDMGWEVIFKSEGPELHTLYAQAVLAASGVEPTNSEPNEEQSVSTNQITESLEPLRQTVIDHLGVDIAGGQG